MQECQNPRWAVVSSSRGRGTAPAIAGAVIALMLAILAPVAESRQDTDISWRDVLEVASGEAHMGPWRMNESDFRYVDDASVALRADGMAAVVWVDQARQNVFLQRYGRDGEPQLEAPTNVSRSANTFSWLPRVVMATDEPDSVYVLWQEIIFSGGTHGGEILFARSPNGGETFSAPINLSNTQNGAGKGRLTTRRWDNGSLDLAEGPDGELWAAWTEYEGRLRISRSRDGGHSFSAPQHIAGSGDLPARAPSIAVDGDGRIHLAWTVGEDPAADIRYTVSDSRGESFDPPRTLDATGGHADAPKLAVGGDGIVHLVYAESPDGPWQQAHIRYTRARAGERFRAPEDISSAHAERFASVGFPSLAVSGADLYVLWELFPRPGHRSRGLGMTHSTDSGEHFAAPEIVPHSGESDPGFNGSLQGMLMRKLAVNDAGDIAVVNSTFQPGETSLVRLIRGHLER
ncbi:sialidase family protein [Halomonas ramblicola]|uniref:sialidase family protein n=1 Tax=Halomonas ramblicola TaxID=747349 RepID=UPI0025B41714|nr:sialidase family protein [Halomonas ramblicola]MDN3519923.1 sialidase family protein [Halomonas ramblicola]